MEEIERQIWQLIDEQWSDMMDMLKVRLPMDDHKMFDDSGSVVPCDRPMAESIVCDKTQRSHRLFFYLAAAGLIEVPEALHRVEQRPDGGRDIIVDAFASIRIGTGGKQNVERNVV